LGLLLPHSESGKGSIADPARLRHRSYNRRGCTEVKMLFGNNREALRRQFVEAWQKVREGRPVTQLEDLIASVIAEHPEYHHILEQGEAAIEREWTPEQGETNPFLHMGMHIAVREQLSVDRP